ncbi:hypothetical protein [Sphingobium sp. YR657]|uniref:hypothetical protein n=1 Tax=Sphingobium sp. YR657 TaxID=1884366 RepID=UPI003137CD2D
MDTPGHYFPLFFHDEAVALAAGHRPCGQCRPAALAAFVTAWKVSHGISVSASVPLRKIDQAFHRARLIERKRRRTTEIPTLPEGAFILAPGIDKRPLLVFDGFLWPWQHGAYGAHVAFQREAGCGILLTPEPIIAVLRAGYPLILAGQLQRVATDEMTGKQLTA